MGRDSVAGGEVEMTTRRGFIQGVLTSMVALVLPKTAKGGESAEPIVEPEHELRVDGRDCWTLPEKAATSEGVFMMPTEIPSGWEPLLMIPTCARPASKLYGPGHIDWIHFPECSIGKLADEYEEIGDFVKIPLKEFE